MRSRSPSLSPEGFNQNLVLSRRRRHYYHHHHHRHDWLQGRQAGSLHFRIPPLLPSFLPSFLPRCVGTLQLCCALMLIPIPICINFGHHPIPTKPFPACNSPLNDCLEFGLHSDYLLNWCACAVASSLRYVVAVAAFRVDFYEQ